VFTYFQTSLPATEYAYQILLLELRNACKEPCSAVYCVCNIKDTKRSPRKSVLNATVLPLASLFALKMTELRVCYSALSWSHTGAQRNELHHTPFSYHALDLKPF